MKTTQFASVLTLISVLALGCSTPAPSAPAPSGVTHPTALEGKTWAVVSVAGRPPVADSRPTIIFSATDLRGSTGCNGYGGSYRYDETTGGMTIGENLLMTEMACPGGRDEFESAFIAALAKATDASLDANGRLVLSGAGGQILLAAAP
jgi:heat shock protein HslJ